MPIYEFACRDCDARFDRLQGMSDPTPACPRCSGREVTRLISIVAGLVGSSRAGASSGGGCACGGACACRA